MGYIFINAAARALSALVAILIGRKHRVRVSSRVDQAYLDTCKESMQGTVAVRLSTSWFVCLLFSNVVSGLDYDSSSFLRPFPGTAYPWVTGPV